MTEYKIPGRAHIIHCSLIVVSLTAISCNKIELDMLRIAISDYFVWSDSSTYISKGFGSVTIVVVDT